MAVKPKHGGTCQMCGRALEYGETCECRSGFPRDGLRAKCKAFSARNSYHGAHYISCGGKKTRYPAKEFRDVFYRTYCCDACDKCPVKKKREEQKWTPRNR